MKLVDYLRALLSRFYSKKENGIISELSAPNVENLQRYEFTGGSSSVAPFDGFVSLLYLNGSKQTNWRRLSLKSDQVDLLSTYLTTYWASGWHRVKKGQVITCTCGDYATGGKASFSVVFCKTMGGG